MTQSLASNAAHLVERAMIARASDLARAGDHAAADQLIAGLSSAAALDLRARMRAQRGLLGDAERFWQLALQLDPDQPAYRDGLQRIAQLQRRPSPWLLLLSRTAAAVLVLSTFLFVVDRMIQSRVNAVAARSTTGPATGNPADTFDTRASAPAPIVPALDLEMAGVTIAQEAGELVARFDGGIFDRGVALRPGAEVLLADLGHRIATHGRPLLVRVVGMTDDVPLRSGAAWADNAALGFARALAVADRMRVAGVPAHALAVESRGSAPVPADWGGPAARAHDRTVTIRVRSGGEGGR